MTRAATAGAAIALAAALGGCGGEVGTLRVSLVTAPDSDLLERIQRVRVVVSDPPTVVEAERGADGQLAIDLEIDAQDSAARVSLEGFDGAGERIAVARSAPLPVSAVDASIALYLAPPQSMAEAPVALDPPRSEMGGALLAYGAVLAGGRGADGAPRADLVIYNVYDHQLQVGVGLPEARASATVIRGVTDLVYVFGGLDGDGDESADGWAFNTSVAPAGAYTSLISDGNLARAGAASVLRGADGAPRADLVIYNVYDHQLQVGLGLPEARASATVIRGVTDLVYVFGGLDGDGDESADGWAFNTSVAPAGAYTSLISDGNLARAGAASVLVTSETFLVTGTPAAQIDGLRAQVGEWPDAPPTADGAAARVGSDATAAILVAGAGVGETGAVTYDGSAWADLDAPDEARRTGHAVITLPDGRGLVVGGAIDGVPTRSAALFDPDDRALDPRADFLATGRTEAAIAATAEVVLVVGGVDEAGAVVDDAELFDAASLEPIASLPLVVPRRGAIALPLPNGQILVAGGTDADGAPVGALELFTPATP